MNNLPSDFKDIDNYLRQNVKGLGNLKLTKVRSQVVEGVNYEFTYSDDQSNKSYVFTVWDRPWLKDRKITEARKISTSKNDKG